MASKYQKAQFSQNKHLVNPFCENPVLVILFIAFMIFLNHLDADNIIIYW